MRTTPRLALLTSAVLYATAAGSAPIFIPLGDLPGGTFQSDGADLSADGQVAVGSSRSADDTEAFRWEGGTMSGLGYLPDNTISQSHATSADGAVVVGHAGVFGSGNRIEAFRWEAGTMVGLGDLPGGSFFSIARGVSADGSVVVGRATGADGIEAFRWEGGVMVGLGGDTQSAYDVSADGSVVIGTMSSAAGPEAFLWENGTVIGLGDLAGGPFWSEGRATSADGSIVVGFSYVGATSTDTDAFLWENGLMVNLGGRAAVGISADGELVVGWDDPNGVATAVLWDPLLGDGPIDIRALLLSHGVAEVAGWRLSSATAITDDRVVLGTGTDPNGNFQAFLAVLPTAIPEPRTGLLLAAAIAAIAWRERHRH